MLQSRKLVSNLWLCSWTMGPSLSHYGNLVKRMHIRSHGNRLFRIDCVKSSYRSRNNLTLTVRALLISYLSFIFTHDQSKSCIEIGGPIKNRELKFMGSILPKLIIFPFINDISSAIFLLTLSMTIYI